MKKEEIIERIIDTFTDMGCESIEDTAAGPFISLDEADTYLAERRGMEQEDLNPEDWLPEETTPEMYMEAYNCYVRRCRHDYMVSSYVEWMKSVEPWEIYGRYCIAKHTFAKVLPTEDLKNAMSADSFPFYLGDDIRYEPSAADLIVLGQNSSEFNINHEYCYYDDKRDMLVSTDTPFADDVIDAEEIVEWMLNNSHEFDYVNYSHADTVPNCWPWEE